MSAKIELLLKNEKLLTGIQIRQKNLHNLSNYLSELESQLALIFASSPDIIVFLDDNANIIKISDAAFSILGYSRGELIDRCLWDYIAAEDIDRTKDYFDKNKKRNLVYGDRNSFVNHWIAKDGKHIRLVWRFSFCSEWQQHTVGIASDITEFGANDMYNSKLLYKALELSADGILITDAKSDGNPIVYANKSFELITGYSTEDTVEKNITFFQTNECTGSRSEKALLTALKNGGPHELLMQGHKKNGELFYGKLCFSPVLERGSVVNYIVIVRDVTEELGETYEWSPNTKDGLRKFKEVS